MVQSLGTIGVLSEFGLQKSEVAGISENIFDFEKLIINYFGILFDKLDDHSFIRNLIRHYHELNIKWKLTISHCANLARLQSGSNINKTKYSMCDKVFLEIHHKTTRAALCADFF